MRGRCVLTATATCRLSQIDLKNIESASPADLDVRTGRSGNGVPIEFFG